MDSHQFRKLTALAIASPAEHVEALIAEIVRLREKTRKQENDQLRYKAVFKKLLKPDQPFLEGLVTCKSYKDLDMFSYVVLNNTKGSVR